jgi:hypothetical protein
MMNTLKRFASRELTYLLEDELRFSKKPFEKIIPEISECSSQNAIHERLKILEESELLVVANELMKSSSSIWVRQSAAQIASRISEYGSMG